MEQCSERLNIRVYHVMLTKQENVGASASKFRQDLLAPYWRAGTAVPLGEGLPQIFTSVSSEIQIFFSEISKSRKFRTWMNTWFALDLESFPQNKKTESHSDPSILKLGLAQQSLHATIIGHALTISCLKTAITTRYLFL